MSIDRMMELVELLPRGKVLRNYIVPGLYSTLLATTLDGGKLRLFDATREQEHYVVPHNHRYDFTAFVLRGTVEQLTYDVHHVDRAEDAKWAAVQYLQREGRLDRNSWGYFNGVIRRETHTAGYSYRMHSKEWHSIRFGAGAQVLMAEGRTKDAYSSVLLPMVEGKLCDTFVVHPWMMEAA